MRDQKLRLRVFLSGLFGSEVERVLGGGLVPGSLVLVGGDPGVGKSTLVLQVAGIIADSEDLGGSAPVVYVSGEESVEQIGIRADRLEIGTEELYLYSSTDIEDILRKIQHLSPRALIIDSIQTVYLKGVAGSAGGLAQVKECTSALLRFAKTTNIPIILIGHVNKAGDIAGPRVLEHIVDVVLYMEGEKYSSHRLLRPVKNRFGSTDELGVFEMSQSGLAVVSNPSEIFLTEQHSDSDFLAGLAVAVIMDGSRSFLIEIQALCVSGSSVSRHINGIQSSRADMIISVLIKQAGLMLQENAIFLNVLQFAAVSWNFPIPNNIAFIGEIGLGGELRSVPRMEKRLLTVAKLGYKMCFHRESILDGALYNTWPIQEMQNGSPQALLVPNLLGLEPEHKRRDRF
ncbi:DNA REPAIR PROTEIN RADA-LIKE PROTEIN [Salix purpurea]|uniref:DNA REPAIR PROTEIN RADA-LIKE PROTEIN n=1 Tax=Salix purpurea TaxID=77065 RepID=A0A9Q0THC4_SALPP|nr:DNA REPAIR PROTEIN RADA-LIKE PROTEIN [Salix purpurea]